MAVTAALLSRAGNIIAMWWLVIKTRLPYLPANILSIASCSVANFVANEGFVFKA
jgi:putative flippase GtrA